MNYSKSSIKSKLLELETSNTRQTINKIKTYTIRLLLIALAIKML